MGVHVAVARFHAQRWVVDVDGLGAVEHESLVDALREAERRVQALPAPTGGPAHRLSAFVVQGGLLRSVSPHRGDVDR